MQGLIIAMHQNKEKNRCKFLKTLPTIWGTYMKLVTKHQISAINSCWEKCDENCAYMLNVYKNQQNRQTGSRNLMGPKTLPTILWVAFLDPSNSYFLFADLVGFYTHWTYMHIFRHIFLSNYWWQIPTSCLPKSGGIIGRFLPSIVAEENVTKNVHICSMCIKIN
jgi:hypothetical protein